MFTKLKYIALLLLPVLFLAVISLDAQAQRRGKKKKKIAPTADQVLQTRLTQHVGVLAADSLEGRRTGTEGEKKAVRYITAQYEAFGIPGAGSAGYLQPFEIDEGKKMPTIPSRRTMLKEGPSRLRRSDRQTLV
jgi:hypothetical protein